MPVRNDDDVPSIDSIPATVTAILPPLPVPNVSAAIPPLGPMTNVPAETAILPASPVPNVLAAMPVGMNDDVPSIDSAPATATATLPPLPAPKVSAAISPLGLIVNVPAMTFTLPP